MSFYCTLADARREIKAVDTVDDDYVLSSILTVSTRIDQIKNPRRRRPVFWPYYEQRAFELDTNRINSNLTAFFFDEFLLSATAVLLDGTDVFSFIEAYPLGTSPYKAVRFTSTSKDWYDVSSDYAPWYVKITGYWGIHRDYANAWVAVDALAANLTAGGTSMTVANVDGPDWWGLTPRISAGSLVRIESEICEVYDTDTTAQTASIRRGRNGTTAAAHASGATVEVFDIEPPIRRVAARQAALMYARRGAFQVETLDGVGAITYPQDLLPELKAVLQDYIYG